MEYQFENGDRVVLTDSRPIIHPDLNPGDTGTVCFVDSVGVGVRWDHKIRSGHTCYGICESGYGWYVLKEQVEPSECNTDSDIDEDNFVNIVRET